MFPEKIIFIGVATNLVGIFWYLKSIIYGGTKPNLVTWSIWALAPLVGVFLQLKAGAGLSVLGVAMAGFGPLLVVILSMFKKDSIWKITKFDIVCGFFSLIALVLYVLTNKIGISIIFAILSDALAAIPTIKKAWQYPETESSTSYAGGIINNILSLLIIKNWIFSIYSFSIYFIIVNLIIVFCIYRKKFLKAKLT
ncbi:MAG: hypothetical protein WCO07_01775 [bacterium]